MKLTKAQQKTIDDAKTTIDKSRKYNTYEEYFINEESKYYNNQFNTPEKFKEKNINQWNSMVDYWESYKKAIVLTQSKTETLKKLESLGLIEIIRIDNCNSRIDKIKILNY
jgi:hypothetical protein